MSSVKTESEKDSEDICVFFLQGECKFGAKCKKKHPKVDEEMLKIPEDFDCGICMSKVKANNKTFGLLPNCEHIFCLDCIRQ